jgi:hypothetical protein
MKQDRKAEIHRLTTELNKSRAYEAEHAKKLVQLLFEDAKDGLVSAFGDELIKLQGEARAMDRLYKRLTETVPKTTPEEQ